MMGKQVMTAVILSLGLVGGAYAQTTCTCPGSTNTRLNISNLNQVLTGNTVCVGSSSSWEAQEQHVSGGVLRDYKRGPSSTVDPTSQVGTWSTATNGSLGAQVTYTYGSTSYVYGVCSPSTTTPANGQAVGFCPMGSGTATTASLRVGLVGCS